jgi:hypothetical protein
MIFPITVNSRKNGVVPIRILLILDEFRTAGKLSLSFKLLGGNRDSIKKWLGKALQEAFRNFNLLMEI